MITTSNEILQECISLMRNNTAVPLCSSLRHFITAAERLPDSSPVALLFSVWRLIRCSTPHFISVVPSGSLSSMLLKSANSCDSKSSYINLQLADIFLPGHRLCDGTYRGFFLLTGMLSEHTTLNNTEPHFYTEMNPIFKVILCCFWVKITWKALQLRLVANVSLTMSTWKCIRNPF